MSEKKETVRVNMLWPVDLKAQVKDKVGDRGLTGFTLEAVRARIESGGVIDGFEKDRRAALSARDEARAVAQSLADSIAAGWPVGDEFDQRYALASANLPDWIDTTGWSTEFAALVRDDSTDEGLDLESDAGRPEVKTLTAEEVGFKLLPETPGGDGEVSGSGESRVAEDDEDLHRPMALTKPAVPAETPPVTPVDLPHDRQGRKDDLLAKVMGKAAEKGIDLGDANFKSASDLPKPPERTGPESEPEVQPEPEPEQPEPTPASKVVEPAPATCPACGSELVNGECWECF